MPARRLLIVAVMSAAAVAMAAPASADGGRYAIIVQGASGDPDYATLHRRWVDGLAKVLRERFKIDGSRLAILAETPAAGEQRSSAESVRTALAGVAKTAVADDLVFIMLIGHGSGTGDQTKFNLVGPDLTMAEWSALLKPIAARVVLVDSTSASFPFLAGLAAPNRVVITATSTYSQTYHTIFPEMFIQAIVAPEADADKNGRISLLEAFNHASRGVVLYYEQNGRMATELPSIDDTGDGKGRDATSAGDDGLVAGLTYLDVATVATVADPELQAMLNRQVTLTEQIDDLRRRRPSMAEDAFESEFEKLITELALVSRDIRRRKR
jgi:hypothetical protein